MSEKHEDNQLPEELQDWIITEQIFKESGLELDQETIEHNDFLRNLNAVGSFLASISGPTVQFAQINDGQILLAFDEVEPVDLGSPFFPVDDEGQLWALHHQDVDDLESYALESPQISALTAYGYNHADKMMLFNLQEQRILSINAAPEFAQAMVRGLAVEHAMEPWNATRTIYLVGFEDFGKALKYNLASYHSNIVLVDALTDLEHNGQTLENCTIFSIGQGAGTVSEFVRTTTSFALGIVADVPIGGGFIYYQESDDRGALEPGDVTIFPFLMSRESEDYQIVEENYHKHLSEAVDAPAAVASVEPQAVENLDEGLPVEEVEGAVTSENVNSLDEEFRFTDEDFQKLLEPSALPVAEEEEPEPEPVALAPEPQEAETAPPVAAPTAYLKLMGPAPELIGETGSIGGFPAEVIAYTYLQQQFGDTAPTFSDLCTRLWAAAPTGSNKSKFSARRKRAKEKLHELIPTAEFITERDGWHLINLVTDIDHIPAIEPQAPLTQTPWAEPYLPALNQKISEATHLDS